MNLPGLRVLLAQSAPANISLAAQLLSKNAIPIHCSAIEIVPLDCMPALQNVAQTLSHYIAAVFVSRAAVTHALPRLLQHSTAIDQKHLYWAAMGFGTADLLRQYGIAQVIYPHSEIGGLALLPELLAVCPPHTKVVIFKGEGGLQDLQTGLIAHQIEITEINCYRRVKLDITIDVADALDKAGADVIVVTSAESLMQLRHMLEKWPQILHKPLVVVSQRLQTLAQQQGFSGPILIATGADSAAIVAAIENYRI